MKTIVNWKGKALMYFVMYNSDGTTYIAQKTEEELLRALGKGGEVDFAAADILKSIPDADTNYWKGGVLIIKGEIIAPKAKEVVIRFEL